jgi:hypothetical protein
VAYFSGFGSLGTFYAEVRHVCRQHPKIHTALIRISEILLQKKVSKELVYSESPVRLTEDGKRAIQESGFQRFYDANKRTLIDQIKKTNPKNLADLEEACKSVMLSLEDTLPNFHLLKQFAYSNGEPISNILFAGAVALRDILQKELAIKE